jgi:hypothetical protein
LIILNEDDAMVRLCDCIKHMRDTCEKQGIKFINKHIESVKTHDHSECRLLAMVNSVLDSIESIPVGRTRVGQ